MSYATGHRATESEIREILGEVPPEYIFTKMERQNVKSGLLMTFSNLGGCPKENYKGDDLVQAPCKNSFYKAIGNFLRKNKQNRVVFMGDFFGKGPYTYNIVTNIMMLIQEFNHGGGKINTTAEMNKPVEIVIGSNDLNLWRFKYELHHRLLQKDVHLEEIDIKMDSMVKFRGEEAGRDKVYGDGIPMGYRITKNFKLKYSTVFVSSLYQRILGILKSSNNFEIPYSLLFNNTLNEFYFLVRNEQNPELMTLTLQLSAFYLAYPFIPKEKFQGYISAEEIENAIEYIIFQIEEIIQYLRSYREDIYVQKMTDLFRRIRTVLHKSTEQVYLDELMPFKQWRATLLNFYNSASLIHYDQNYASIFCYDDTLPLYVNVFLPFLKFAQYDPQQLFKKFDKNKGQIWSLDNYYDNWLVMYKQLLSLKIVQKLINLDNPPINSESDKKRFQLDIRDRMDYSLDLSEANSNMDTSMDGGGPKNKSSLKKFKQNRKHGKTLKKKRGLQGGGELQIKTNDLSANTGFDNYMFNYGKVKLGNAWNFSASNNNYERLNFHHTFRNINRMYREILKFPAFVNRESELNLFLALLSFGTLVRKNHGKNYILNSRRVRRNQELYDIMCFKKIHNLFVANIDLGMTFPLVIENIYGVNHIFTDISKLTRFKFPTYRRVKFRHDNFSDFHQKEQMTLKNFPLTIINKRGEIEITSLNTSGTMRTKKTYLGEYYFHTFRNFMLTHEPRTDINIYNIENSFTVNLEGDYNKVDAHMLPLFKCDRRQGDLCTFFIDDMYFIKLFEKSKNPGMREKFMIIDLSKSKSGGKVGTYIGNLSDWFGFFWDRKRLYLRKIANIESMRQDLDNFIKMYLPAMSTLRLSLPFTPPLNLKLKKKKSILNQKYKLDTAFIESDFKNFDQVLKVQQSSETDPKLEKLRQSFESMFNQENLLKYNYKLKFTNLDNADFVNGVNIRAEDENNMKVLVNVHSIPFNVSNGALDKGAFKNVFAYNSVDRVKKEKKDPRYVIKIPQDIGDEKDYYREIAYLLYASFNETGKPISHLNKLESINNYDLESPHIHYISLKTQLGNLNQVFQKNSSTLKYFQDNGGQIKLAEVKNLMKQLYLGIQYLHSKYIVHNDIYERNIILFLEGDNLNYKIIDFGASSIDFVRLYPLRGHAKGKQTQDSSEDYHDSGQYYNYFNKGIQTSEIKFLNVDEEYEKDIDVSKIKPVNKVSIDLNPKYYCDYSSKYDICGYQTDSWCYGGIILRLVGKLFGLEKKFQTLPFSLDNSNEQTSHQVYKYLNYLPSDDKRIENFLHLQINDLKDFDNPGVSLEDGDVNIMSDGQLEDFIMEVKPGYLAFRCLIVKPTIPNFNFEFQYQLSPELVKFLKNYLCDYIHRTDFQSEFPDMKSLRALILEVNKKDRRYISMTGEDMTIDLPEDEEPVRENEPARENEPMVKTRKATNNLPPIPEPRQSPVTITEPEPEKTPLIEELTQGKNKNLDILKGKMEKIKSILASSIDKSNEAVYLELVEYHPYIYPYIKDRVPEPAYASINNLDNQDRMVIDDNDFKVLIELPGYLDARVILDPRILEDTSPNIKDDDKDRIQKFLDNKYLNALFADLKARLGSHPISESAEVNLTLSRPNDFSEILGKLGNLKRIIDIEKDKPKKTGHWIWYVYPNIKDLTKNGLPKYEIMKTDYEDTLIKNEDYQGIRNIIDTKPLSWFSPEDEGRVTDFRTNPQIRNIDIENNIYRELVEFGSDGNCLFNSIIGALRYHLCELSKEDNNYGNISEEITKGPCANNREIYSLTPDSLRQKLAEYYETKITQGIEVTKFKKKLYIKNQVDDFNRHLGNGKKKPDDSDVPEIDVKSIWGNTDHIEDLVEILFLELKTELSNLGYNNLTIRLFLKVDRESNYKAENLRNFSKSSESADDKTLTINIVNILEINLSPEERQSQGLGKAQQNIRGLHFQAILPSNYSNQNLFQPDSATVLSPIPQVEDSLQKYIDAQQGGKILSNTGLKYDEVIQKIKNDKINESYNWIFYIFPSSQPGDTEISNHFSLTESDGEKYLQNTYLSNNLLESLTLINQKHNIKYYLGKEFQNFDDFREFFSNIIQKISPTEMKRQIQEQLEISHDKIKLDNFIKGHIQRLDLGVDSNNNRINKYRKLIKRIEGYIRNKKINYNTKTRVEGAVPGIYTSILTHCEINDTFKFKNIQEIRSLSLFLSKGAYDEYNYHISSNWQKGQIKKENSYLKEGTNPFRGIYGFCKDNLDEEYEDETNKKDKYLVCPKYKYQGEYHILSRYSESVFKEPIHSKYIMEVWIEKKILAFCFENDSAKKTFEELLKQNKIKLVYYNKQDIIQNRQYVNI